VGILSTAPDSGRGCCLTHSSIFSSGVEHASISPKYLNAITCFIVCDVVSNPRDCNPRPLIDWHRSLPEKATAEPDPHSSGSRAATVGGKDKETDYPRWIVEAWESLA